MARAIVVRTDYTSGDARRVAQQVKNTAQACRLLAIAAVLDGRSREQAAKIGGMDRQALRDWVIRFNAQGPDGLVNRSSPGTPGKLTDKHKAFLARLVEEGPIPAVHGVVRWRACDLIIVRTYRRIALADARGQEETSILIDDWRRRCLTERVIHADEAAVNGGAILAQLRSEGSKSAPGRSESQLRPHGCCCPVSP